MTKRYYKYEETHRTVNGRKQKLCTRCKKWKEESEFNKDRNYKDGLANRCRDCDRTYDRERYRKGKKDVKERLRYEQSHRIVNGIKQKLCCRCKQWKKESLFHRNRRSKDGLQWKCKECESKYARKCYNRIRKTGRKNLRYEDRHREIRRCELPRQNRRAL